MFLLGEELSTTQRHLDMSGVPMPNFMNVGHSLRRELNENNEDEDYRYLQIDSIPFILKTPELIIEEEEDSDLESSTELNEEEGKNKQYFPFEKSEIFDILFHCSQQAVLVE